MLLSFVLSTSERQCYSFRFHSTKKYRLHSSHPLTSSLSHRPALPQNLAPRTVLGCQSIPFGWMICCGGKTWSGSSNRSGWWFALQLPSSRVWSVKRRIIVPSPSRFGSSCSCLRQNRGKLLVCLIRLLRLRQNYCLILTMLCLNLNNCIHLSRDQTES